MFTPRGGSRTSVSAWAHPCPTLSHAFETDAKTPETFLPRALLSRFSFLNYSFNLTMQNFSPEGLENSTIDSSFFRFLPENVRRVEQDFLAIITSQPD